MDAESPILNKASLFAEVIEKQWTTSDPICIWEQCLSQQGYMLCDELAGSLKPFEIGEALAEEMRYPSLSVDGNGV